MNRNEQIDTFFLNLRGHLLASNNIMQWTRNSGVVVLIRHNTHESVKTS